MKTFFLGGGGSSSSPMIAAAVAARRLLRVSSWWERHTRNDFAALAFKTARAQVAQVKHGPPSDGLLHRRLSHSSRCGCALARGRIWSENIEVVTSSLLLRLCMQTLLIERGPRLAAILTPAPALLSPLRHTPQYTVQSNNISEP